MGQVLVFRLGEEHHGLEVSQIQEVVESPRYHYIPLAPATFPGAINFHGSILPVLDLGACFGYAGDQRDGRLIVLAAALCPLALAVTAVRRIVTIDADDLLPPRPEGRLAGCSRAAFDLDGEMINLLDAARLLASLEKTGRGMGMGTGGGYGA
jgi:chemotaxis signal transduction protein